MAAADEPVVSGPRLEDLDLTKPGWHQIVEGGIWGAAIVVLGSEAVSAGGHKFCYVIQGSVQCDASDGRGTTTASEGQLIIVGGGAVYSWSIRSATEEEPASVLVCGAK